jgi:uncharacterized iron-regulated membrane protein
MNRFPLAKVLAVLTATIITQLPSTARACAACMGDVNSKTAPAINDAIFLMLGCIGFMLLSLAGFAFYLMRRASAPLPPHAEFTQPAMTSPDGAHS